MMMGLEKEEKKYTIREIEVMTPKELYELNKLIKVKDFRDMTELKEKIILSVMKKDQTVTDTNFYTKDFQETKELTFKEDELRRQCLEKYMIEIKLIYHKIQKLDKIRTAPPVGLDIIEKDDPLITKIKNEFENIEEQFQKKNDLLVKKPRCSLLICGDSGAGKSSFINLLINEKLLPTSIRSNTACQVRLTYDQHERAEVIDLEGKTVTIEKTDFLGNLKNYLENLENRTQVSCKSATVFLKCPILQGGLDIYDTIGLGENLLFNEELTKDLTDITGILFLLKKNNPIGDNTVGGLSKVINYMATNGIPGGSMHFIINMCDLLDGVNEREELTKNVKGQIRDKCSGLYPEITTFSTKRELFLQENQYMSKEYTNIMSLIQKLHINSINTNTVSVFEFLFRFVVKTIEYITESEEFTNDDKVHKKSYIHKLKSLESDRKLLNQSFKKQNEKLLKENYEKYKKECIKHFNLEETKKVVVQDVVNKHGQLFGMTNNDEIDKEIMSMTHEAILKNFKEYIENKNILKTCCDEMLSKFLQQFAEHQKKKDSINVQMNRHIDSVMNYIKGDLTAMDFNDLIGLPTYQRKVLKLFTPIMVPGIEFKNTVKKGIESWFSWIISKINMANIQKFYEDTQNYVSNKSVSYYSKFVKKNRNIDMLMTCLFKAPSQVTQDFENYLAEDMNYLAKNIDLLDEDMRKKENVIQTYKEIKEKLEIIKDELCKISLLHLQTGKNDIMREQMELISTLKQEENIVANPILKNRNRIVYRGHFKNFPSTDSAILMYKSEDNKSWKDLYDEFVMHRDILKMTNNEDNANIVKCFIKLRFHILFSVNDNNDLHPIFFVNGIDHSLTTYMAEFKKNLENDEDHDLLLFNEICRIIKDILNGLGYLHANNLVHYDLTIDSIGFNTTYNSIKLSSISAETKVNVDYIISSTTYVLEMSHLPVKIITENTKLKYSSLSDMYAFGIILYQLRFTIHPFFNVVKGEQMDTINKFVSFVSSKKLENLIIRHNGGFAEMLYSWSSLCWEEKITAVELINIVKQVPYYGEVKD